MTGKTSVLHAVFLITDLILTQAYSNPKYTWPLGDTSYAYEVVKGSVPTSDMNQCGFNFQGLHPDLSFQALSLNAYQYPYVDLTLSTEKTFDKFSFSFLVKPVSLTGCIMHYKHSGSGSHVTKIVVYIENGKIGVDIGNSNTIFGSVETSGMVINANSWNFISISKDYDTGKIIVSVETSTVIDEDNNFSNNERLEIPGTFRIGSTFDNSRPSFQGEITCFNMFDDVFDVPEKSSSINECKENNWSETPTGLPTSNGQGCPYFITTSAAFTTEIKTTTTLIDTTESDTRTSVIDTTEGDTTTSVIDTTESDTTTSVINTTESVTTTSVIDTTESVTTTSVIDTTESKTTTSVTDTISVTDASTTCVVTLRTSNHFKQIATSTSIKNETLKIKSIYKTSIRHCAIRCAELENCASFVVTGNIGSNARDCYLYNDFDISFTKFSANMSLYVHRECL